MNEHHKLFDGEVLIWIEQESVHMKAVSEHGDPIELTSEMCIELAEKLKNLAKSIDA